MEITSVEYTITVPAGRYYLGDPCYVVPDDLWGSLLTSCDFFRSPIGEAGGHKVLAFRTAYGDGEYRDQYGNTFGVDAGLIGLVPEALVDADAVRKEYGGHMPCALIEFARPVMCWNEDGRLHFGKYTIDTRGTDE